MFRTFHIRLSKKLLISLFAVFLQMVANAQEETVIDHKGTLIKVRNNTVITAATAPIAPLQNDIWFDTTENLTKIYDGTVWLTVYQNIYLNDGTLTNDRIVDADGNSIDFTNVDSGYNIEGATTGVGETAANTSDGALLHIRQDTPWSGSGPWALFVEGYTNLNGFRINAADGQRSLFTRENQLGFATQGNVPITFTQNASSTRLSILSNGVLQFHEYGLGSTIVGTEIALLGIENDGRVIPVDISTFDTDVSDDFSGDFGDLINIPAGIADGDDVDDADNNATNEIQTLSILGNDLTISGTGGNTVTLPSGTSTISADVGNSLSTGTDSGIFYESPVKAFGKIAANGGLTKVTPGITITKMGPGRYRVNLPSGLVSDANYIIQLSQPGRGGAGNDDPGISYNSQTATNFQVIIGDNDNGGTDRARFDSEFMFTILDF